MASIKLTVAGRDIEITTDRSESSYGQPVVVVDGEITDIRADCAGVLLDHERPSVLDALARSAGVHDGPQTRTALYKLADSMLPDSPRGVDYDRVIDEFKRQGRRLSVTKTLDELTDGAMTGSQFRCLREALDLSQMQMAQKLGVTIATISRWENDHVAITEQRAVWIRAKLVVDS